MKEGLRSSDMVGSSGNGVVEEINDADSAVKKCDPGLGGNDISKNESFSSDLVLKQANDEVNEGNDSYLSLENGEGNLVDGDRKENELDLVLDEVDCAKKSLVVAENQEAEGVGANTGAVVVTSGVKVRLGRPTKRRKKAKSTVKGKIDDDADYEPTQLKKKRGRPPNADGDPAQLKKKRGRPPNAGGDPTRLKKKRGRPPNAGCDPTQLKKKRGRPPNADCDPTRLKKKRGRPPKKINSYCDTTGPEKKKGNPPKKRGRPKKVQEDSVVNNARDLEKDEEPSVMIVPQNSIDTLTFSLDRTAEGKKIGSDDSAHMVCEEDDADVNGHRYKCTSNHKVEKRGRKRNMLESSVTQLGNGANEKKAKDMTVDGGSEVVGRILRSRAVVVVKQDSSGLSVDVVGKRKKKNDVSGKKINAKIESDQLIGRHKKRFKRGRPSKVHWISETLKMVDSEKQKKNVLRKLRDSKLVDTDRQQKVPSCSNGAAKKIVRGELNKKKHKEAEKFIRIGTEKQLLKDSIREMLKRAGWTIEYRPRNGKEYNDAVYVSPQGRGYWSVTLAYRVLKQEVEEGVADNRAVSAFTPIPEDKWNSLLRITKKQQGLESYSKKTSEIQVQSKKGLSHKKILKKKHAKEKGRLKYKHEEALKRSNGEDKQNKMRVTLMVRGSKKGLDFDGEGYVLYEGKCSLLSWMIDLGTVPLNGKVKCINSRAKVLVEGKVNKDGIHCNCCNETVAISDFESHSGSTQGQRWKNICLDSGISLLQCLRDSWSTYEKSISLGLHSVDISGDDPNDDTCNICGDGGDLICCDSCPAAFHQKCLDIQKFPSGDWTCVYCSCKFCVMVGESTLEGDQNCDAPDPALTRCRLCEEKYHLLCAEGENTSGNEPNSPTFCGWKCREIFEQLEILFGVKHQMEEGFSWSFIRHSDDNLDISSVCGAQRVESNAKLAVAWSVLDECFLPIVDQRSGINLIRNVVYSCGSNIRRMNYTGFFTAILERGDEIISVASLRIHGSLLAEMPFIGTRHIYRRQGMCRRLLFAIETALCSLNVDKLVLPAISDLHRTWTSVFGFNALEESHKKEMKCMSMIAFPGVDMLQKPIVKGKTGVKHLPSVTDVEQSGNRTNRQICRDVASNSEVGCPVFDTNMCHEVTSGHACKTGDVEAVSDPNLQLPNVSSNGVSDMTGKMVDGKKEAFVDIETPAEDVSQINSCHGSDEVKKMGNVPSGSCEVDPSQNVKVSEQSISKVEDKLSAGSYTICDPVNCNMKTPNLSDVEKIADCELNDKVNSMNHSKDQNVVNDCASTQALVLV